MSRESIKLQREGEARARLERHLRRLSLELAMGTPRRYLDPLVELCELLVEQTGGNLLTTALRAQLADLRARVETRGHQPTDFHLRIVKGV
jgi:hypothetical protein